MSLLLKECRWCGQPFLSTHFNGAYCSGECKNERTRERRRMARLPVEYRKTKKLDKGVPTIYDVVEATIEHREITGRIISYGKMVVIMEGEGI